MSSEKSSKKVTSSIAIKINSSIVSGMFIKFIIIDAILCAAILAVWCINSEISFYGEFIANAERSIKVLLTDDVIYKVIWADGKTMIKDGSEFFHMVRQIGIVILIIEAVMIFQQIIFGTAKIRKSLKPLNDMAEAASRLSNITFDESKVHDLEDAIWKISPDISGEQISTGDTELQGLEKAINGLLQRMTEANRQQIRFVSDASHELRTPIAVIQGYANMLDRWGKKDEKILEEAIAAIKSESENMKVLVEQLLFLARGINGKTILNCKEFILNDLIKEVYEESKLIDEKHFYELKEYGTVKVFADMALLKQTARILTENAIKYTDEKESIIFKVGINKDNKPYFAVQDNGIGISEEDVSKIFDRFFRADTARTRKTGGTGLGLSIANWIVYSHKGYFSVLSREGIGTRITVILPNIE